MRNEETAQVCFAGWPVPDEFLTEIGRVSALWACLESWLNLCLGKLAGFNGLNDARPLILITHSSVPQRLDMLGALCEQLEGEFPELAGYKTVVSQLKAAQATRNRFMHHTFSYDAQNHCLQMAVGSARGKLKTAVESVSLEDIKRASIEMDEACRALYKLVFGRELPAAWQQRRG